MTAPTEPPDPPAPLTVEVVAAEFGISASDWRARAARGYVPRPDRYERIEGALQGVYDPATIDAYRQKRAQRESRDG